MGAITPSNQSPPVKGSGAAAESPIEIDELFRQLMEGQVCWIADVQTQRLLYVNPAYEDLWAPGTVRYLDRDWAIGTVHDEDLARCLAFLEKEILEPAEEFYRTVRAGGSVRWIHCRRFPVRYPNGKIYRAAEEPVGEKLCTTVRMSAR
jgi:PAS domain-containing protein